MVEITLSSRAAILLGKIFYESKIDGDTMLSARDARRALQGAKKAFNLVQLESGASAIQCPFGPSKGLAEDEDPPTKAFRLENAAFKFLEDRFRAVKGIKDEKDPRGLAAADSEAACELDEAFSKAKKDVDKS